MEGMECIREDEEQQQRMDPESGDGGEGLERNAKEELAKMASSLMAGAHPQPQSEDEEGSSNAAAAVKPRVKRTRKLLFRRLRVCVEDGRVFIGKFHCLDKQGNIILYDTKEFRPSSSSSNAASPSLASEPGSFAEDSMEQRSLGLVLIPARCRTSLFVECSLHEQFSLLSV